MKAAGCCPVCASQQCRELLRRIVEYPGADVHSNLLDIDYVRNYILFDNILHSREPIEFCFEMCMNCGLIFFSPRPEESDMTIKYKFTGELGDVEEREKVVYKTTYDNQRALELHKFIDSVRPVRGSNIVDIGGGHGLNLKYFLDEHDCFVVDYVRQELIPGAQYLCQTTQKIPKSMHYDVALCCHMLEHVVDPVKEVLRIKDILESGGLVYVEVPLGCWNEYKETKNFLTHINFFSEGSLYYLLNMCGLRIRFLKVMPRLNRTNYELVVVACAENSSPESEAYQITRKQMDGKHYGLRAYSLLLNIKLMRFRFLKSLASGIGRRLVRYIPPQLSSASLKLLKRQDFY